METPKNAEVERAIVEFFSEKLSLHGATPRGADWNGADAQAIRFTQLCKLIDVASDFSVNDVGCGYGPYCDYLQRRYRNVRYAGVDICPAMVEAARVEHAQTAGVRFDVGSEPTEKADYGFACGLFGMRFGRSEAECRQDMLKALDMLDRTSVRGFAFNSLTKYSDADKMRADLYYADPLEIFHRCKGYARDVALLHDYGLYDFTILVRKVPPIFREG